MQPTPIDSATEVSDQLSSIEKRLGLIEALIERQSSLQRTSVGWRPSLRTLFVVLAILAVFAAWLGAELRQSQMEARAADSLSGLGAGIESSPSETLLVALLPGSPGAPPRVLQRMLGRDFFIQPTRVSISGQDKSSKLDEIRKALKLMPNVQSLKMSNIELQTNDLAEVFQLAHLENLDLSHSKLDQLPIEKIANTSLRWLDASHTWLGDQAAFDLSYCHDLTYLILDRTTVTDESLESLKRLANLRFLSVQRTPISLAAIKKFSAEMPDCYIQYQPLVFDSNGRQNTQASYRGRCTLGSFRPSLIMEIESRRCGPLLTQPRLAW